MKPPKIILIEDNQNFRNGEMITRSALQGIEYAKYLRRVEKQTYPIIFTSFLSPNDILAKPNTAILTAIGHSYLQLPYTQNELDEILRHVSPLNDIQLKDIILNFCQLRSSVRESFHAFKGRIREIKNQEMGPSVKAEEFKKEFDNYESELKKDVGNYPEVIKEYKRIVALYEPTNEKSIELIEAVQEESFVSFLPIDEDAEKETSYAKKPWKVLFLDDKPKELEPIFKVLKERGIDYEKATSSEEAKQFIEKDLLNQFTVVVTDYRLFEPDTNGWIKPRMQPEQGYDFLMWLSKQDRYNAMVALSGLSKWFLMDSFRQKRINVKVYSKSGLLGGGAKLFVDDLEYQGNRIYDTILSLPTASEWEKQLKNYYKWLRLECEDADKIEEYVEVTAEGIIGHLDNQLKLVEKIVDIKEKYIYLELPDKIGRATENLPPSFDPSRLDLFKLRLAYRRVLIYYAITGTIQPNIVAKILNLGSAAATVFDNKGNESEDYEYKGMKKQVFSIQAVSESDIPFNILIEEKIWLKNKMGMEIQDAQVKINLLHDLLNCFFDAAKKELPALADLPAFKDAFKSGKSTSAINKDLSNLLQQLDGSNKPLKEALIKAIKPVLSQIQPLIHPINAYQLLINTINAY